MESEYNTEAILTCAVTGGGDTAGKHPVIPVAPRQIADAAFEAANVVLLEGQVRAGPEDDLYLKRGVIASNGQLVEKSAGIVDALGARVLTPAKGREKLGLAPRH